MRQNVIHVCVRPNLPDTFAGKRRRRPRTISVAGFRYVAGCVSERSGPPLSGCLGGNQFGMLKFDGFLRVLDVVRVDAGTGLNPQNFTDETAQWKITVDPHDRWRLQFSERYNYSDAARADYGVRPIPYWQVDYELSDRWAISYEQVVEEKKSLQLIKGRNIEYIGLTRHFGPFDAGPSCLSESIRI